MCESNITTYELSNSIVVARNDIIAMTKACDSLVELLAGDLANDLIWALENSTSDDSLDLVAERVSRLELISEQLKLKYLEERHGC